MKRLFSTEAIQEHGGVAAQAYDGAAYAAHRKNIFHYQLDEDIMHRRQDSIRFYEIKLQYFPFLPAHSRKPLSLRGWQCKLDTDDNILSRD